MIFAKTNLGRLAAFDPQSQLPVAQKKLLRLIDGKTRLVSLMITLGAAACSLELIESLLDQDLIQLTKTDADQTGMRPTGESRHPSRTRHLALVSNHGRLTAPASIMALLEQDWEPAATTSEPPHSSDYQDRLGAAKDNLIQFVTTHMPQQAQALFEEIDQIRHNDQLKATIMAVLSMAYQANPDQTRELQRTVQQLLED